MKVADNAFQIDLETFGADLGLSTPVAAFQEKRSSGDCCMQYEIYSLEKPPKLVRTISGGDRFTAADTDLDGRVEIWTHDAAAVENFEKLAPSELESAPSMVLRLTRGKLLDASSEFKPHFDHEIERLRQDLSSDELRDFKVSDGKLVASVSLSLEQIHRLRRVKGKILGIVWAYLYSGRDQAGWQWLTEAWPAADQSRIHQAIVSAHSRGISSQVDGLSQSKMTKRQGRAQIFDAIDHKGFRDGEITAPQPIMLRRPPLDNDSRKDGIPSEWLLELVVDSAGKVRSAERVGKQKDIDPAFMYAVTGWKFIPGFKDGRAVASRTRLAVSLAQ